ncbi:GntR family transcriptional regulator [Paramagnetospirillum kuznetsovii]|uniref:GntR family transcriptional regulator n=1 Tax=Paramagnetospirillum kuznetsovii TaxID=2053833 RepID=A0A364NVC4_9PROT|nr:GntR family transcriptional regulator [Paramagnetospirillum kuznetsovii]RAU21038.1 GntR family transcriptional regulator [Paramagnetospirillum kuznetsovii]
MTSEAALLHATDSRLPLYARLRDVLTRRVAAGEWAPDRAIPAESTLADSYGVSLGTVRKALEQLVDEGLLERRQGSGTFVRRARFDQSLFRFFRLSGGGAIPASRILRREVVDAWRLPATPLGVMAGGKAIRMQRLRLWGDEPFLAEDILLPFERFAGLMDLTTDELGPLLYPVYEAVCGQIIARAEEELTVAVADEAAARLLRCPVGSPVVRIERLALAHDGTALEWRRSSGLASQFRYKVDIK